MAKRIKFYNSYLVEVENQETCKFDRSKHGTLESAKAAFNEAKCQGKTCYLSGCGYDKYGNHGYDVIAENVAR